MSQRDARRAWIPTRRCVTSEAASLWTHGRRAEAQHLHNECADHQDSGAFPRSPQSASSEHSTNAVQTLSKPIVTTYSCSCQAAPCGLLNVAGAPIVLDREVC